MPALSNLTTIMCAAALALGLAACGGGSSGTGAPPLDEAAMKKAAALAEAIRAARNTAADGTFDDTPHMVAPSVTAANDGTTVTVGVTEGGTPQGGAARGGALVVQTNEPAAVAGWTGVRFRRGTAAEHLIAYTDIAAPESMPFTPENLNKLNEVSGLTGDAIPAAGLAIDKAWLPLVASTSLAAATPRGSVTHASVGTGADAGLSFTGSFSGAPGTYSCSGVACSVTLDDRGTATAVGGTWSFAPEYGAMVGIPDYDHLYLGWWLNEKDGAYGFQSFAGAVGFPAGAAIVQAAMEGSATYTGAAAGIWVTEDISGGRITRAESGEFTAAATLKAHFFGANDAGMVTGEISSFRDGDGRPLGGWSVELEEAPLTVGRSAFAGKTSRPGGSGAGSWQGEFHGTDGASANARPSHVTGRFDAQFPGVYIAGAFGGAKGR